MAQQSRRDPRAKVLSMTVRYKSATIEQFIEHHSHDVSRGGMFIKTPQPFPPGTLLKFEVRIAGDRTVMQGVGRVVWKRETSAADHERPAGMGVKFIKLDDESRKVIDRLLGARENEPSAFDIGSEGTAGSQAGVLPPISAPPPTPAGSFFPKTSPGLLEPAPEDKTVMKQAAELLQEVVREVGGPAAAPPSNPPLQSMTDDTEITKPGRPVKKGELDESGGSAATVLSSLGSGHPPRVTPEPKAADELPATRKDSASALRASKQPGAAQPAKVASVPARAAEAPVRPAAPSKSSGGARIFVPLLLVGLGAGAIYWGTKGSKPAPEPPAAPVASAETPNPPAAPATESAPSVPEPSAVAAATAEPATTSSVAAEAASAPSASSSATAVAEAAPVPVEPIRPAAPRPRTPKRSAASAPVEASPETAPTVTAAAPTTPAITETAPTSVPAPAATPSQAAEAPKPTPPAEAPLAEPTPAAPKPPVSKPRTESNDNPY